ncbi:MAG: enoyl-CoA hydratase/isomerase family protein [Burkholderiales bacterium]
MTVKMPVVESETHDGTVVVTLNRPAKRNALSHEMLTAIHDALRSATQSGAETLILTGNGPAFCAGADMEPFKHMTQDSERQALLSEYGKAVGAIMEILDSPDLISICAVNGPAAGGGWALAMGCDFRIASERALFWYPESNMGRVLGELALKRVVRDAGPVLAREMVLLAKRYSGKELLAHGLVNEVVPAEQLRTSAGQYASCLRALKPHVRAGIKERINALSSVFR